MRSSYRYAGRLWFTHRVLCAAVAAPAAPAAAAAASETPPGYDCARRATKNHSAANEPNIENKKNVDNLIRDTSFPVLHVPGDLNSMGFHSSASTTFFFFFFIELCPAPTPSPKKKLKRQTRSEKGLSCPGNGLRCFSRGRRQSFICFLCTRQSRVIKHGNFMFEQKTLGKKKK